LVPASLVWDGDVSDEIGWLSGGDDEQCKLGSS
jgi:hypothetical protein